MGIILSSNKRIEGVVFRPLGGSKNYMGCLNPKGVYKEKHGSLFVLGPNGTVYTDSDLGRQLAIRNYEGGGLRALVAFRLITEKERREHVRAIEMSRLRTRNKNKVETFVLLAKQLEVTLTVAQRKRLSSICDEA